MKSLGFLLISSLLLTCTPVKEEKSKSDMLSEIQKLDVQSDKTVDSILNALKTAPSLGEEQILTIHHLLQKIIDEKTNTLMKLDEINSHMDSIETRVKEYVSKKKVSTELRKKLLVDIQELQQELNEIKPRILTEIIQKPIPNNLKSLTDLPPGNYRSRIDRTHILQFFVDEHGELFVAPLQVDSLTTFNGAPLSPKVVEQIKKIRENLRK